MGIFDDKGGFWWWKNEAAPPGTRASCVKRQTLEMGRRNRTAAPCFDAREGGGRSRASLIGTVASSRSGRGEGVQSFPRRRRRRRRQTLTLETTAMATGP